MKKLLDFRDKRDKTFRESIAPSRWCFQAFCAKHIGDGNATRRGFGSPFLEATGATPEQDALNK